MGYSNESISLMAHLLRRAGFGAARDELESYLDKGYEATVEELLNPIDPQAMPDDVIRRYYTDQSELRRGASAAPYWLYRIVTSKCQLEEKIALFWHRIFATAFSKLSHARVLVTQIQMFRYFGMGNFNKLLLELSKNPAMILWLDNYDNHKGSINENYGRELLELFSMGVGNYSEQDIKEGARAFTGWTIGNTEYMSIRSVNDSNWPYGNIEWFFEYNENDHDDGPKTFLGEKGNFNGEDIIEIICKQSATADFISRHLYHFFCADEPPVPQWPHTPPSNPQAIKILSDAYFEFNHDIRSMLRVLFNSEFFKSEEVRFARVKSPVELVGGTMRLVGNRQFPNMDIYNASVASDFMGQALFNPPTVEGWHEGHEWIDSGGLVERVNFASEQISDPKRSGVRLIINRIESIGSGNPISPQLLVDTCLDLVGPINVSETTRAGLIAHAGKKGDLQFGVNNDSIDVEARIIDILQLIVSTAEYQLA